MEIEIGHYKGEICNRDGCKGVIVDEPDCGLSCSCHINPPCSKCTTDWRRCPECDWSGEEDGNEVEEEANKRTASKSSTWTPPKRKTLEDLDKAKIDWFISDSWHSGMEVTGAYPEGTSMYDIKKAVGAADKQSMAKFKRFGDGIFTLRYFTD